MPAAGILRPIRHSPLPRQRFPFTGPWLPPPSYFPGNYYGPENGRPLSFRSHLTEIQPGHIKVRFPFPAGIPQENKHKGKRTSLQATSKG